MLWEVPPGNRKSEMMRRSTSRLAVLMMCHILACHAGRLVTHSLAQLEAVDRGGTGAADGDHPPGGVDLTHTRRTVIDLRSVGRVRGVLVEMRRPHLVESGTDRRVLVDPSQAVLQRAMRLGQAARTQLREHDVDARHRR